jgi:molybdate transport system substrate-binding protein
MHVAQVLRLAAVVALGAAAGASRGQAQPRAAAPLLVFAASDLGPALAQIVPRFERQAASDVTLVLGSTGMLAQQIRNGAPADVFFAANESFVNDLAAEHLTLPNTAAVYARGRIAIVTLKSSGVRMNRLEDLASAGVRRVAIANPQHAPYGLAAKQALQAAGTWAALEPRLVFGENVQQAVQFVRSGSAQAGVVARSVADTPDLRWTLVDHELHAPLNQMAVVLARTKQPAASKALIDFVNGAEGRSVMRPFGFGF